MYSRDTNPFGGPWRPTKRIYNPLLTTFNRVAAIKGLELVPKYQSNWAKREEGLDWPPDAETMVGIKRLGNVQECIATVVKDGVPAI